MPTAKVESEPKFFIVLLLTDKEHLERARQVIREGEPALAMNFDRDDGETATFTANDIIHHVKFRTEPMERDHLEWIIRYNVFWDLTREPYPEHSARISIRRIRSEHAISDLLALTDVVHALTRKIPTHAIVWLPYAAISKSMFDGYYEDLYEKRLLPVFNWIKFLGVPDTGGNVTVVTMGLAELKLKELEFVTTVENVTMDVIIAKNAIEHMINGSFSYPDGAVVGIDIEDTQGWLKISHRPSIRADGGTVCFLEITRLAGGRPLPGVH